MHNPPKVGSCFLEDCECVGCKTSKLPSASFNLLRMCEKDIGSNSNSIGLDQISYQLEMCEDLFFVKCNGCNQAISRRDFLSH